MNLNWQFPSLPKKLGLVSRLNIGYLLYTLNGDEAGDLFGASVSSADDLNGDGLPDFIVGASNGGESDGGHARVFSGVDGTDIGTFAFAEGGGGNTNFLGLNVNSLGDIDGDGIDDFVVGSLGKARVFTSAVPEPNSIFVIGITALFVACRRRRVAD